MSGVDLSHREAARLHASRAAFKRFGFALAVAEYELLVARVRSGRRCKSLGRAGELNRTMHRLRYRGKEFCAVYDPALDAIVTLVPQEFPPGFNPGRARTRMGAAS